MEKTMKKQSKASPAAISVKFSKPLKTCVNPLHLQRKNPKLPILSMARSLESERKKNFVIKHYMTFVWNPRKPVQERECDYEPVNRSKCNNFQVTASRTQTSWRCSLNGIDCSNVTNCSEMHISFKSIQGGNRYQSRFSSLGVPKLFKKSLGYVGDKTIQKRRFGEEMMADRRRQRKEVDAAYRQSHEDEMRRHKELCCEREEERAPKKHRVAHTSSSK